MERPFHRTLPRHPLGDRKPARSAGLEPLVSGSCACDSTTSTAVRKLADTTALSRAGGVMVEADPGRRRHQNVFAPRLLARLKEICELRGTGCYLGRGAGGGPHRQMGCSTARPASFTICVVPLQRKGAWARACGSAPASSEGSARGVSSPGTRADFGGQSARHGPRWVHDHRRNQGKKACSEAPKR